MTRWQRAVLASVACLFCMPAVGVGISGWAFGEGFTSQTLGSLAEIYGRAFSLGNMAEICGASQTPSRFVVRDPIPLRVGQSIQRIGQVPGNKQDVVIVDAYDARGQFIPHVPVIITVIDPSGIVSLIRDGDYLEALAIGEAELEVTWACGPNDGPGVQSRIRVVVSQ